MKLADLADALGAELRLPEPAADGAGLLAGEAGAEPRPLLPPAQTGLLEIIGVAGIEHAGACEVTFVANVKYAPLARTTRAAAILVEPEFAPLPLPTLRIANPYLAFARALDMFYRGPKYEPGVHATAVVDGTAVLGEGVHLGPYVVVGAGVVLGAYSTVLAHCVLYEGARIGAHFFAHAHAVVREHCVLGDYVTLQNGAVIGTDGFGFARNAQGAWQKIPQTGPAILEDYVEVQALATVDRASVGETRIGRGVKIDNLVQVGHGCSVGEDTLLCAQVGLAGSTHVGRGVILAGQVGVAGHCRIGDGAVVTAQSGVPGDVAAGSVVSGTPAIANREWLRAMASLRHLPETLKKLRK